MNVGEAIQQAKTYISEVFADEDVSSIRLEEVEYDEVGRAWLVTIGLLRPSASIKMKGLAAAVAPTQLKRDYRTVRISDDGKGIPSVRIRQFDGES